MGHHDYNSLYYSQLIKNLEKYIQYELQDSAYYAKLAQLAPNDQAKKIILELSKDEKLHAQNFQQLYFMLTNRYFKPNPLSPIKINAYEDALKIRILAETKDYKKYGEQYLKAPSKDIQDLFFVTKTVEAQHAMRIPVLLEDF
jgi:rubrerythrin